MPNVSTLEAWDAATGGELVPLMRTMRSQGDSYETIARAVHAKGVSVSYSTVYRWVRSVVETAA